ncbi:MAG: NAD(P)H-dependent flavin oxidoreductase [Candidatus Freyrarchaeum guaymaensis]
MFKTRITELFGIEHPIIGGAMHLLSRAELVAAISNAGGLGILASTTFEDLEDLRAEIQKTRELTKKPFGVNLNLFPAMRPRPIEKDIDLFIDEGVEIIESSGSSPEPYIARLKESGIKIIHKVPGVRYARTAERIGCDAVTVVGFECGGHPGLDDVTSLILVPETVDAVSIPVCAGGGFCDSRSFLAALALGAEGVVMGTRFVATEECIAHPKIKEWIVNAKDNDTILMGKAYRLASRLAKNKPALMAQEMEAKGASLEEVLPVISGAKGKEAWMEGEIDAGVLSMGMVVGRIDRILTVKEVIDEIINGAKKILERLNQLSV